MHTRRLTRNVCWTPHGKDKTIWHRRLERGRQLETGGSQRGKRLDRKWGIDT